MVTKAQTTRTRDPKATRAAILRAAVDEFARFGPDGARVDRIAATAVVNKRMLYHYFGGKERLLQAVLTTSFDEAMPGLASATTVESIVAAVRSVDTRRVRLLAWSALSEGSVVPAAVGAGLARIVDRVAAVLQLEPSQAGEVAYGVVISAWAPKLLPDLEVAFRAADAHFDAARALQRLLLRATRAPKPRVRLRHRPGPAR